MAIKTLQVRIKDKHSTVLRDMARQVNTVWNFAASTDVPLWMLIYGAMMQDRRPKTVADFERVAKDVADMVDRRAALARQAPAPLSQAVPEDGQ